MTEMDEIKTLLADMNKKLDKVILQNKIGLNIQMMEATTMIRHKRSNCKFCKQCTEVKKRLSGKGAFCYDYEEKETNDENNTQSSNS